MWHCAYGTFAVEERVWRTAQANGQTRTYYAVSGGDLAETGEQWLQTARQAGWASHSYLHAVGDGAEWIARLSDTCFGTQGRFLLDLFHVSEYLAAAAPPEQPDDLSRQKARLCAGEHPAVIAELATTPDPAAPVRAAHRYLRNRTEQLDYPAALARQLPLGSGLIESGHRHILHKRLKIPGGA